MTSVPLGAKVRRSDAPSRASSAMDEAVVPSALSTVACQPETPPVSSFAVRIASDVLGAGFTPSASVTSTRPDAGSVAEPDTVIPAKPDPS